MNKPTQTESQADSVDALLRECLTALNAVDSFPYAPGKMSYRLAARLDRYFQQQQQQQASK